MSVTDDIAILKGLTKAGIDMRLDEAIDAYQVVKSVRGSVTDDIAEEIAKWCTEQGIEELSCDIIGEYLEIEFEKLIHEIEAKLKAKGIAVGP